MPIAAVVYGKVPAREIAELEVGGDLEQLGGFVDCFQLPGKATNLPPP
jgi:hypothetical protein